MHVNNLQESLSAAWQYGIMKDGEQIPAIILST